MSQGGGDKLKKYQKILGFGFCGQDDQHCIRHIQDHNKERVVLSNQKNQ